MLGAMNDITSSPRGILENFIVFEGIDGTGTTTQLNILSRSLSQLGIPFYTTAEPTDSGIGQMIRKVLSGNYPVTPQTLAFLYATDRNEHLYGTGGIQEHTRSGDLVICDRYFFSSLAYQGNTCGIDIPERLNQSFPLPSLLIYFDLSPETALSRISSRGTPDIFERGEVLLKVSEAYDLILERFASEGLKILRVDGSLPIPRVSELIWKAVFPMIRLSKSS